MRVCIALVSMVSLCLAGPLGSWQDENPQDDTFLGLAWHAAAGEINEGRDGKFYVPAQVTSARTQSSADGGKVTEMEVLFQESWCSTEEGNDLEDVCESMCPLYFGGAQAVYMVTVTESASGDETTHTEKVRDVENGEAQ